MRKLLIILAVGFLLLFLPENSRAFYDPLSVPNNKFGIHIQSENDLDNAANLVNSSSGDWGYVTLVITQSERNHTRWQKVFDNMRRKHLIPIIRIATEAKEGIWEAPNESQIESWVVFLNSLNWVIKNRYVIIGNEPNHAKEWGGRIDPAAYSSYLKNFSIRLKSESADYFILPAGLDASAPNSSNTMEETKFLTGMLKETTDIFDYIDGWNSHSYPNPSFSGPATGRGKGTVGTFDWEISYLNSLGVSKDLPIFITETGWSNKDLGEEEIAGRLRHAFENVWSDSRIVAVTPFILNYTAFPFDVFSWQKKDGSLYSFYHEVSKLTKVKGEPLQEVKGKIIGAFINPFLIAGSSFKGVVLAQNLGQSIWVTPEVQISDKSRIVSLSTEEFHDFEPDEINLIYFTGNAPDSAGKYDTKLMITYKGKDISDESSLQLNVIKPAEVKKLGYFDKIQIWLANLIRFFKGP